MGSAAVTTCRETGDPMMDSICITLVIVFFAVPAILLHNAGGTQ